MQRIFVTLGFCFLAANAYAMQLRAPMPVTDMAVTDVNGDDMEDIVALCAEDTDDGMLKSVAVFVSNGKGSYARTPLTTNLPERSGPAFLAAVEKEKPKALVIRTAEGGAVFSWTDEGYVLERVSPFNSILPVNLREPRFLPKTAHDLDNDGIDEWLIPAALGYEIHSADGLLYKVQCDTVSDLSPVQSSGALLITHKAPAIHIFELPDDGGHAIAFLTDEYADFAYGPEFTEHARFKIPVNLEEKWDTAAQLHDITNNGLPDLIVTQTQGTINLSVLTHIYFAEEPFVYPTRPNASFSTKGSFAMPLLTDIDGDEYADLLTIKVPFGVTFFANLLLRQKIKFKVEARMFEDGGFDEEPSLTSNMTIDAPDGREQAAYTLGDFDADGRIDVALGSGSNQLRIHRGEEGLIMSKDPWRTLDVSPIGTARALDLDGQGGDDLVIFQPGKDSGSTVEVILF